MKFSEALQKTIDTGIGIYRPSWNGNAQRASGVAQWVAPVSALPEDEKLTPRLMTTPFLFISQPNGRTPWVPSQGDLFAEDWETL